MDRGSSILLLAVSLFGIIYFAVRLAIKPMLNEPEKVSAYTRDFGLVYLRDIEVLNNKEL